MWGNSHRTPSYIIIIIVNSFGHHRIVVVYMYYIWLDKRRFNRLKDGRQGAHSDDGWWAESRRLYAEFMNLYARPGGCISSNKSNWGLALAKFIYIYIAANAQDVRWDEKIVDRFAKQRNIRLSDWFTCIRIHLLLNGLEGWNYLDCLDS